MPIIVEKGKAKRKALFFAIAFLVALSVFTVTVGLFPVLYQQVYPSQGKLLRGFVYVAKDSNGVSHFYLPNGQRLVLFGFDVEDNRSCGGTTKYCEYGEVPGNAGSYNSVFVTDLRNLAAQGVNVIQISMAPISVMPLYNQINMTYLQSLNDIVGNASQLGIYSILRMANVDGGDMKTSFKECVTIANQGGFPCWQSGDSALNMTYARAWLNMFGNVSYFFSSSCTPNAIVTFCSTYSNAVLGWTSLPFSEAWFPDGGRARNFLWQNASFVSSTDNPNCLTGFGCNISNLWDHWLLDKYGTIGNANATWKACGCSQINATARPAYLTNGTHVTSFAECPGATASSTYFGCVLPPTLWRQLNGCSACAQTTANDARVADFNAFIGAYYMNVTNSMASRMRSVNPHILLGLECECFGTALNEQYVEFDSVPMSPYIQFLDFHDYPISTWSKGSGVDSEYISASSRIADYIGLNNSMPEVWGEFSDTTSSCGTPPLTLNLLEGEFDNAYWWGVDGVTMWRWNTLAGTSGCDYALGSQTVYQTAKAIYQWAHIFRSGTPERTVPLGVVYQAGGTVQLAELEALGIRFAIVPFNVGYQNPNILKQFKDILVICRCENTTALDIWSDRLNGSIGWGIYDNINLGSGDVYYKPWSYDGMKDIMTSGACSRCDSVPAPYTYTASLDTAIGSYASGTTFTINQTTGSLTDINTPSLHYPTGAGIQPLINAIISGQNVVTAVANTTGHAIQISPDYLAGGQATSNFSLSLDPGRVRLLGLILNYTGVTTHLTPYTLVLPAIRPPVGTGYYAFAQDIWNLTDSRSIDLGVGSDCSGSCVLYWLNPHNPYNVNQTTYVPLLNGTFTRTQLNNFAFKPQYNVGCGSKSNCLSGGGLQSYLWRIIPTGVPSYIQSVNNTVLYESWSPTSKTYEIIISGSTFAKGTIYIYVPSSFSITSISINGTSISSSFWNYNTDSQVLSVDSRGSGTMIMTVA
jgi:hypothetical protein